MPNYKFFNDGKGNVRKVPSNKIEKFKSVFPDANEATEEQLSNIESKRANENEQKRQQSDDVNVSVPPVSKVDLSLPDNQKPFQRKTFEDALKIAQNHHRQDPNISFRAKYGAYKDNPELFRDEEAGGKIKRKEKQPWYAKIGKGGSAMGDYKQPSQNKYGETGEETATKTRLSENYLESVNKQDRHKEKDNLSDFLSNTEEGRKFVDQDNQINQYQEELKSNMADQVDGMLDKVKHQVHQTMLEKGEEDYNENKKKSFFRKLTDNAGGGISPYNADTFTDRIGGNPWGVAQQFLEDSKRIINEASRDDGNMVAAGRGLAQSLLDVDTWSYGITEADKNNRVLDAVRKFENDEELTAGEESMLDALALNLAVNQYYQDDVARGYGWGETAGVSLPYMIEFALNPISGAGKGIAKGIARYGVKKFGQGVAKAGIKRAGTKAGARAIGDLTAGLGMTLTTGSIKTAGDVTDRVTGQGGYDVGDYNDIQYSGHEGAKSPTRSITESIGANVIEYQSETMGESGIARALFNNKASRSAIKGLRASAIGKAHTRMMRSNWGKSFTQMEKQAQWHGAFGEWGEEYYETFMNSIFVKDDELSDLVDLDQQVDVFMGLFITQGAMSGGKTATYTADRVNTSRKLYKYNKQAESNFEQWGEMKQEFDNLSAMERVQAVVDITADENYSKEAKEAFMKYANTKSYIDALSGAAEELEAQREAAKGERIKSEIDQVNAIINENVNESTNSLIFANVPELEDPVQVKGDIVLNEEGKIDIAKSGEVFYTDAEGKRRVVNAQYIDIVESQDAEAVKNELAAIKQQEVENEYANDATRPYEQGEVIRFTTDGNTSIMGGIVGINNGNYLIEVEGMPQPVSIQPHQIINEDNLKGVDNGVEVDYTNPNGDVVTGEVQDMSLRADGVIIVDNQEIPTESIIGIAGESNKTSAETPENDTQPTGGTEQNVSDSYQNDKIEEDQAEQQAEAEKQEFIESLPKVESGQKKGQIDPKQMTPEQTLRYSEYTRGQEKTLVAAEKQVSNLEKALAREQKKLDNNPFDFSLDEKVDAIQEQLDIYKQYVFDSKKKSSQRKAEESTLSIAEDAKAKEQTEAQAQQEEQARQTEIESLQGVPDVTSDNAENARVRGYRSVNNERVDRQEPIQVDNFTETERKFGEKVSVPVKRSIVEADNLQPSHLNGVRNNSFFITEAQPKDRVDDASQRAAEDIATNINPAEITEGVTAYTGSPIVNSRGEVIQGNNRVAGLKQMNSENAQKYKDHLAENADKYGMNAEQVQAMNNPVAVDIADISDTEAIQLGQLSASDTESGGTQRISAQETSKRLGNSMGRLSEILFNNNNEDLSVSEVLEKTGKDAIDFLHAKGAINDTQYQSSFDKNGNITPEAKTDLQNIASQLLFEGGNDLLKQKFESLPASSRKAILQTIHRDADSSKSNSVIKDIQDAIEAYNLLIQDEGFTSSRNYKEARHAAEAYKGQGEMFNSESNHPLQKYNNFAIELAILFKTDTQKGLRQRFNTLYNALQGKGDNLFNTAEKLTLKEAIKEHFNNIDYVSNRQQNERNDVDGRDNRSAEREQRGEGETTSGERNSQGEQPADSRARTQGDNTEVTAEVERLSKRFNTPITVYNSAAEIPVDSKQSDEIHEQKKQSKGWYDPATGEVYLNAYNATNKQDVQATIFHELVAHKGIKDMLGAGKHKELLTSVFDMLPKEIQDQYLKDYGSKYVAADEYIAYLAENENNLSPIEKSTFEKIKQAIIDFIEKNLDIKLSEKNVDDVINALLVESRKRLENKGPVNLAEVARNSVENSKIKSEADQVNTDPTEGQKEAGNYKKGHINVSGFDITIENPKNSQRKGVDPNGNEWSQTMNNHYGYFKRTKGKDGDHIDVFVGDNTQSDKVFVVDQVNKDGSFDEHKVMLGFDTEEQAKEAYLSNYEDGWQGLGNITETTVHNFKKWTDTKTKKRKPFAEYKANQETTSKENLQVEKKEAHEMTYDEFYSNIRFYKSGNVDSYELPNGKKGIAKKSNTDWFRTRHAKFIKQALEDGKTIPENVLSEYKENQDVIGEKRSQTKDPSTKRNIYYPKMTRSRLERLLAKPIDKLTNNDKEDLLDYKYLMENEQKNAHEKGLMDILEATPLEGIDNAYKPKNIYWITNINEATKDFKSEYNITAESKPQSNQKIEDFGEKIEGENRPLYRMIGQEGAQNKEKADQILWNLSTAMMMDRSGKRARLIKRDTGWEKGADGKWRYEQSDIVIKDSLSDIPFSDSKEYKVGKLSDIIEDDKGFFEEYPDAKDIKLVLYNFSNPTGASGSYGSLDWSLDKSKPQIEHSITMWDIDYKKGLTEHQKNTLIHETQHFVQGMEGFARGGNQNTVSEKDKPNNPNWDKYNTKENLESVERFKNLIESDQYEEDLRRSNDLFTKEYTPRLEAIYESTTKENHTEKEKEISALFQEFEEVKREKFPTLAEADEISDKAMVRKPSEKISNYEAYKRLAGEVEARNAARRSDMSEAERRSTLAELTEDVVREDQIILFRAINEETATNQTETPEFKEWFGDSKIVDKDGQPLVVYHGTSSKFNEFKSSDSKGQQGETDQIKGMYFTDNLDGANFFSLFEDHQDYTKKVYLSMSNPYIVEGQKELKEQLGIDKLADTDTKLKEQGYDGLVMERGFYANGGPHRMFVAFEPTQIKSATNNAGTFDKNNADIRFRKTKTPEFKEWFGDWENNPQDASKVVNEDGTPKVVYHGTEKSFNKFDQYKTADTLFWFSSDKEAVERGEVGAASSNEVMPVYLNIKNPAGWDKYESLSIDQIIEEGYDGVKLDDDYIAFNPNQIKSAINNDGSFDPSNPDIRFRFEKNDVEKELQTERDKYGGKEFEVVGDNINSTYYSVEESAENYTEIHYNGIDVEEAIEEADNTTNITHSEYANILIGNRDMSIPIKDIRSEYELPTDEYSNEDVSDFVEDFVNSKDYGDLEDYFIQDTDDYIEVYYGVEDNEGINDLINDTRRELSRDTGVNISKYSNFYVTEDGTITNDYETNGKDNKEVSMRIADHTHNPRNGHNDINIVITNNDPTSSRFWDAETDLVFDGEATAEEISKEIQEYVKSNMDNIRFRNPKNMKDLAESVGSNMSEDLIVEYDKKYNRFTTRFREAWEDAYLPVKMFQDMLKENGVDIAEYNDFYKQATHIPGKNDAQLEFFKEKYQRPVSLVVHDLQQKGFSYRDIENYMFAKHGLERNEFMRQAAIDKYIADHPNATQDQISNHASKLPNDFAGITALQEETGDVNEYISSFEEKAGDKLIDNLWNKVKKATDFSLTNAFKSGSINRKLYKELKNRYNHFVPLRGHDKEVAEDRWDYKQSMGTFYTDPFIRAKGRKSRAESPIAYIGQMAHSSIMRGNKNKLNQTILRLAQKDKSGLTSVSRAWYENKGTQESPSWELVTPEFSENLEEYLHNQEVFEERMEKLKDAGMATQSGGKLDIGGLFIKPQQAEQHEVHVDQNGIKYTVYINANPAIARAINGQNKKSISKDLGVFGKIFRNMAANFTTRNPQFIATNFSRDYNFANVMLLAKENPKYVAKFNKNIPIAANALTSHLKGNLDLNKKTHQQLYEFMINGGKTGFSHIFELDRAAKALEKEAKKGTKRNALDYGKAVVNSIDAVNDVVENMTRLSVYMTSRNEGKSITSSIHDAKTVTVNFNQKGAGSSVAKNKYEKVLLDAAGYIRPLYLFTNAAVQGISNMAKVTAKHPAKMAGSIATYSLTGFLAPMLAGMIGGDDGEEAYMQLSEWERQNNWCVILPNGSFLKIPLPHELRVFHRLGDDVYQASIGQKDKLDVMLSTMFSLSDLLPTDPLNVADASWAELMPDAIRPLAQTIANTNFMGSRIRNEWANENAPGYTKASTNKKGEYYSPNFLVDLLKHFDHISGGDGVKKGLVSANPDVVNHLFRGYFGGLYTILEQGINIAQKTYEIKDTGEFDVKVRETPFRVFYTDKNDLRYASSGLMSNYYDIYNNVRESIRRQKGYIKKVKDGELSVPEYNEKIEKINYREAARINEKIKHIRKQEKKLKDLEGEAQKELEKQIVELKRRVVEGVNI